MAPTEAEASRYLRKPFPVTLGLFLDYSHSEFCVLNKNLQILETFTNQNTDFSPSFSETLGDLQKGTE